MLFIFQKKEKKDEIREAFGTKELPSINIINIKQLNFNFVNEDEIKMLWLSGIHGRSNFKADSKVLGGESVADTLDPLIDQSYMMSAVRTQVAGEKRTIGINPFKSSIWRGPCNSWQMFEDRAVQILDQLRQNPKEEESPISILSYPISNCDQLVEPYDFTLIDYEFIQESEGQIRYELLQKLKYDYDAVLVERLKPSSIIQLEIFYLDLLVGTITLEPLIIDYKVSFNIIDSTPAATKKKYLDQYVKVFTYPELIKCWFESGHALVNAMIFKTGYRDIEYSKFIWTYFDKVDLTKEKPGKDKRKPELKKIGQDDSLFCWVKNNWNGQWIEPADFTLVDKPLGWLYCDDGAGEKADFIHIVEHKEKTIISLIHVKAAKSNKPTRKISVGVHDIVLNQAIKNLRYCSRKALHDALTDRITNSQSKMCWLDDSKIDASKFLTHLESVKDHKNTETRVIVIQPHTQKSVYEKSLTSNIRNQLDVLLVSAENAIHSTGANFHIIGVQD